MGAAGLGDSGSAAGIYMNLTWATFGSPLFVRVNRRYPLRMEQEKSQIERFKEAARELGADDDEERFNEKLKKLAKQKPDDKKPSDD